MNASVERVRDALADQIKAALLSDDGTSLACREETPELAPEEGQVNLTLPRACPFGLDEILDPAFDVDLAVDRIRKSASTG